MGVFDAIIIQSRHGVTLATIQRVEGPLEPEYVNASGVLEPSAQDTPLHVVDFGLTAAGKAYYDTVSVLEGEQADCWVNGATGHLWLEKEED